MKNKQTRLLNLSALKIFLAFVLTGFSHTAWSQISYSAAASNYTQNFDNLYAAVPSNNTTQSALILPTGWVFIEFGSNSNTTFRNDNGSSATGDTYLDGSTGSNERSIGAFASGSLTSNFGASFINNTGVTLSEVTLSYTGEQWKDGGSSTSVLNTLSFAYSIGATSLTSGTYTNVSQLNFTALHNNTTGDVVLDGNLAVNRTLISYTITGISWAPGTTLFIRWSDVNDAGNDDNLAVDGVTFSASASSTPSLTVNPSSLSFGTTAVATISASQSFSVSGSDLTGAPGNLTVTSTSSDFQVSNDNITFGSTTTLAYTSSTLSPTPVYVRFTPLSPGLKTGNVVVSGGGDLTPPSVGVSGTAQTPPAKLAITNISPASPVVNQNFSVTVQAQDASNTPQNVITNTSVILSVTNGTGTVSGTITGTIIAGTNTVIISNVSYNVAETGVVLTATRTSGDNLMAGNSAPFTVTGVATQLAFVNFPSTGMMNTNIASFTVEARLSNNSVDANYSGNVTLTQASGPGIMSGTLTVAAVNGIATFSDIEFNQAGSYTIMASSGTLTPTTSNTIVITTPPFVATDIMPRYIQGINGTNNNRVPYACVITINNLTPNATYRYFNQVVLSSEASTSNGAGISIYPNPTAYTRSTSPSLSSAGNYGTFTADASGNYTGLFVTEPSGNATRFVPGNYLRMRIMLNDGNNGTSIASRVTSMDSAQVINFGTTPTNGTALRGNSQANPKNFVFIYDNVAGTGSPIAGTFVESDGTANTTSNSYASFYSTSVDGVNGAYGTIIPNTNANGIRRIEQRDLMTTQIVGCPAIDGDGVWQSGANTVNPSSGTTAIVLTTTDAPLNSTYVEPMITSITGNSPVCSDGTLNLNVVATGTPSPTYQWMGAGNFNSTTISNPSVTNPETGTYTVTVTNACGSATGTITITVDSASVGGTVADDQSICPNTQPADLTLSGNTGDVMKWQSSADSMFTAPTDINNTTTTLPGSTIGNLSSTTYFRAIVQNDSCSSDTSSYVTITVDEEDPLITAPNDTTVTANSDCSVPAFSPGSPTTSDNCSVASVTNDAPSTFPIGTTPVVYTVTDGNGNMATDTQYVTVVAPNGPAMPGPISGPGSNICTPTAIYAVAPVANATSYTWTVPPGVTIISGQGTNSINVSFSPSFASGVISVTAENSCSSSAPRSKTIIRIPAMPGPISGPTSDICTPTANYSVAPVAGASTYTWTVSSGMTIVSGQGTTNITVAFSPSFNSGTISVRANSACQSSPIRYLNVVRVPGTPGAISGPTTGICVPTGSYSISPVNGASSYTWTVPSGVTITSGQGTTNIQVTYGSGFVSGFVTVTANSSCQTSSPRVLAISRALGQPTGLSGPTNNICQPTGTYTINPVANATSYFWTVPSGVTITSGQGTTSIDVAYGPSFTSGYVGVMAMSACATSNTAYLAISGCNSARLMDPSAPVASAELIISDAYPNPANEKFSFNIQSPVDGDVDMEIYDAQGKLIFAEKKILAQGPNIISQDVNFESRGIILVRIISNNGTVVTRTVIVQ